MAKGIAVSAEQRTASGTTGSRRLRRSGVVPAVVYGDGKPGLSIQLDRHQFEKTMGRHLDEHPILDLDVKGVGAKKVLLQDVQYHPISGLVIHVDFHEVSMTKKLRVEMAIRLVGEPVGVTQQGGVLEHLLRVVMIECLPTDILEHVDVDVSGLSIGQSLNVRNIVLDPAKYRIVSDGAIAVAAVKAPREEEVAATPAATAAEPEVLREKKDAEGEGAEAGKDGKPAAGKDAKAPAAKDAAKKDAAPAAKPAGKEAKK